MKYTASFHTHTTRCNHAEDSEREYIEAAIAGGMTTLGFSDHAPQVFDGDYYSGFRMKHEQIPDYFDTLTALKAEYAGKIDIHIGFEAEYYPKHFAEFEKLIRSFPTEYLIMGQHFLKNEIEHLGSMAETTDEEILKLYVDQCVEGFSTGLYAAAAHPDCIHFVGDDGIFEKHITRYCEAALKYGIPLEINLLGIRTFRHYPNPKFWAVAGKVGNDVICGSDAHAARDVCDTSSFLTALQIADKYGLKLQDASIILKGDHILV